MRIFDSYPQAIRHPFQSAAALSIGNGGGLNRRPFPCSFASIRRRIDGGLRRIGGLNLKLTKKGAVNMQEMTKGNAKNEIH